MKLLKNYVFNKKNLLKYFNCDEDYHIKVLTDHKWHVDHQEGASFLSYWMDGKTPTTSVIVNKDGECLIYKTEDLTMVIGIDCIKIAFILKNSEKN